MKDHFYYSGNSRYLSEIYSTIPDKSVFKILHKSFNVVVVTGLFFLSLSNVALDMRCFSISVYVVYSDVLSVFQKDS